MLDRRAFLRLVGAGAAATVLAEIPLVSAGERVPFGELRRDAEGRVFVRAQHACQAGDLVSWNDDGSVARVDATTIGPIGIASSPGWVQIYGPATITLATR